MCTTDPRLSRAGLVAGPGGNTRTNVWNFAERFSLLKVVKFNAIKELRTVVQIPELVRFHWTAKVEHNKILFEKH